MLRSMLFSIMIVLAIMWMSLTVDAQTIFDEPQTIEGVARDFVSPSRDCRRIVCDSLSVAGLDSMGWSGLIPGHLDDTCLIMRVSLIGIEGELSYPVAGAQAEATPDIPVSPSIHAFIRVSDLRPLFAVTGRHWEVSRVVIPMSLDGVVNAIRSGASVELRIPTAGPVTIPRGGVYDNALHCRSDVTYTDLAVIHLIEMDVDGVPVPVWLVASYGRKNTPGRKGIEEYDTRLELALGVSDGDLRGNTILRWDGFPEHRENIWVVEECKERLREYRREWEPPGPRPE